MIGKERFALNKRSNGGVIENIRRLRDESVQHARGKFEELFGMGTYDDTQQLENSWTKVLQQLELMVLETPLAKEHTMILNNWKTSCQKVSPRLELMMLETPLFSNVRQLGTS